MGDIKMVYISTIVITLAICLFLVFVLLSIYNRKKPSNNVVNINVNVPKFIDDFTTSYSTFDQNEKLINTGTLPNGRVSVINGTNQKGYVQINIKQISTGKIVNTYNYRGTTGDTLTLDMNNTLNLPSKIITIINEIPKQITVN